MASLLMYAAPAARQAHSEFPQFPQRHYVPALATSLITNRSFSSTAHRHRPLNVLFFGTDLFGRYVLKSLVGARQDHEAAVENIDVVCPVTIRKKKGLKEKIFWQADTEKLALKERLHVMNTMGEFPGTWKVPTYSGKNEEGPAYDIGIVASFGKFIPNSIIQRFPLGMLNVHPSLLPKYRGPSPIQTAILKGDINTGVTIQEVHPRVMDGGKILAQIPHSLTKESTRLDGMVQLGHIGGEMLVQVLKNLKNVRSLAVEQDMSKVTTTKLIVKPDAQINWDTMTADHIIRMFRAYYGSEPVYSFIRIKNKIKHVQITELDPVDPKIPPINRDYLDYPPGTMFFARKIPYVEIVCIDGNRLHGKRFVVSGKASTDFNQFIAGYLRGKKLSKTPRFLSTCPDLKRPTPEYVFPPDYKRPELPKFDESIKIVKN